MTSFQKACNKNHVSYYLIKGMGKSPNYKLLKWTNIYPEMYKEV